MKMIADPKEIVDHLRSINKSMNTYTVIMRQLCFLRHCFFSIEKASTKNRTRTHTLDLRKNGHPKNGLHSNALKRSDLSHVI